MYTGLTVSFDDDATTGDVSPIPESARTLTLLML